MRYSVYLPESVGERIEFSAKHIFDEFQLIERTLVDRPIENGWFKNVGGVPAVARRDFCTSKQGLVTVNIVKLAKVDNKNLGGLRIEVVQTERTIAYFAIEFNLGDCVLYEHGAEYGQNPGYDITFEDISLILESARAIITN